MSTPPSPFAGPIRVAACAGNGEVRIERRPRPRPGAGEMLLALRCCGLCGSDLWKLAGGGEGGAVLGHEVVGVVAEIGADVAGFLPGDRVAVVHHAACGECDFCRRGSEPLCPAFRENLLLPGGFSDHLLVRERGVRRGAFGLPPHLADEAAVFLEPAACVLRGLRAARLPETALAGPSPGCAAVLGAGSMGLLHLLAAKALWPALRVVVVDPVAERRERARELGADAAAPPETAREAVAALSGGRGADGVFDTAGGAAALSAASRLGRPGGTVVLFAHAAAGEAAGFDLNAFWKAERTLLATYSSSAAEQREAFRLLVTGRLDPSPLVTHRLPLSRFGEAVELARGRRALKVLLTPDPPPEAPA